MILCEIFFLLRKNPNCIETMIITFSSQIIDVYKIPLSDVISNDFNKFINSIIQTQLNTCNNNLDTL